MATFIRVGLVDGLTPAVAAWLQDMNPAAGRALTRAGRAIRRAAVLNVRATFKRTGLDHTSGSQRRIKLRSDRSAGIRTVRIWHGSGILAAHELGATIPATTIRPRTKRVLAWGGTPDKRMAFSRILTRRAFALPRRPTLVPAYEANASAVLNELEAEYQKLLDLAPPAIKT